jgi:Tfp pilus assembly protein PilO
MTLRNRMILVLVAFAAAVGAYWFLLLSPKRDEVAKLETDISVKQGEVDAAKGQIALYEKARSNYKRNYTTVARLGKAVPGDDDVRSLLVQVDAASDRSKASFRTLDIASAGGGAVAPASTGATIPGASVGTAGFATMPFSLKFNGSYFELSKLFTGLEHFVDGKADKLDVTGRLLLVRSFTLKPLDESWKQLDASVTATGYVLPSGEGLLAGATPTGPAGTAPATGGAPAPTTPVPATTAAISGVTR